MLVIANVDDDNDIEADFWVELMDPLHVYD